MQGAPSTIEDVAGSAVVAAGRPAPGNAWEPPRYEVISLDCEITAYAPDDGGETPLF